MPDVFDGQDDNVLTAYVSAASSNTVVLKPEAARLAARLAVIAQQTLDLTDTVRSARAQREELARAWSAVRGVAAVSAMHFAYNAQCGGLDEPSRTLSDAANALLNACSNSPVFTGNHTQGDLCTPDVLSANSLLRPALNKLVSDLHHKLTDPDLTDAYKAWSSATPMTSDTPYEANIANIILGDALEVLCEAGACGTDLDDSVMALVHSVADMVTQLAQKDIDTLRSSPDTGIVLDEALPFYGKALTIMANMAGEAAPWLGPDGLLLKIALLDCRYALPQLLASPGAVAAFRYKTIPKLTALIAGDDAALRASTEKMLQDVLDKGNALAKLRARAAFADAQKRAASAQLAPVDSQLDDELAQLSAREATADEAMSRAVVDFKKHLSDKAHFRDGPGVNGVLAILAAVQLGDALMSFEESHGSAAAKSAFDAASAGLQGAASGIAVLLKVPAVNGVTFLVALKPLLGLFGSIATGISGSIQFLSAKSVDDGVEGLLNLASGGAMTASIFCESAFFLPVIGQIAAILAISYGFVSTVADASKNFQPQTPHDYLTSTTEYLHSAQWTHGDPATDVRPLAALLGISTTLDAVATAASNVRFMSTPIPPGLTRRAIVSSLTLYAGKDAADAMVSQFAPTGH